jgi:hypothetical protein
MKLKTQTDSIRNYSLNVIFEKLREGSKVGDDVYHHPRFQQTPLNRSTTNKIG